MIFIRWTLLITCVSFLMFATDVAKPGILRTKRKATVIRAKGLGLFPVYDML
jgi:hypothetical protein